MFAPLRALIGVWAFLNAVDDLSLLFRASRLVSIMIPGGSKSDLCDVCDDVMGDLLKGTDGVAALPCGWACLKVPQCVKMCESIKSASTNSTHFPCIAAGYCDPVAEGMTDSDVECEVGPFFSCSPPRYCKRVRNGLRFSCELRPGIGRWVGMRNAVGTHAAALYDGLLQQPHCGEPGAGKYCIATPRGFGAIAEVIGHFLSLLYGGARTIMSIESPGGDDDRQASACTLCVWLTFWLILTVLLFVERFLARVVLSTFPLYYEAKLALMVWLMFLNGADDVYREFRRLVMGTIGGKILRRQQLVADVEEMQIIRKVFHEVVELALAEQKPTLKRRRSSASIKVDAALVPTASPDGLPPAPVDDTDPADIEEEGEDESDDEDEGASLEELNETSFQSLQRITYRALPESPKLLKKIGSSLSPRKNESGSGGAFPVDRKPPACVFSTPSSSALSAPADTAKPAAGGAADGWEQRASAGEVKGKGGGVRGASDLSISLPPAASARITPKVVARELQAVSNYLLTEAGGKALHQCPLDAPTKGLLLERAAQRVSFQPRFLAIDVVGINPKRVARGELPSMDSNGHSDPYVTCRLISPDGVPYPKAGVSTKVQYRTTRPTWKQSLEVSLRGGAIMADGLFRSASSAAKTDLLIHVYDADLGPWGWLFRAANVSATGLAIGAVVAYVFGFTDDFTFAQSWAALAVLTLVAAVIVASTLARRSGSDDELIGVATYSLERLMDQSSHSVCLTLRPPNSWRERAVEETRASPPPLPPFHDRRNSAGTLGVLRVRLKFSER